MTQSELKELKAIGAEPGAAKAEVEQLRGFLRELRDITSEYAWDADLEARVDAALSQQPEPTDTSTAVAQAAPQGKFRMGDLVKKSTGSEWVGRVVGWYSTEQTKEGYAVESSAHRNSVQIYPVTALEAVE